MRKFRTYHEVDPDAGGELLDQVLDQRRRLAERLSGVRTLVAVLSGKGGVGKSAVTANLAVALSREGLQVGALDADLNGPSLARMLAVSDAHLGDGEDGVLPPKGALGVKVMSMELLQGEVDTPLVWKSEAGHASVWRGTAETTALREFLADVVWGPLDVLLVDVPPGIDKIQRLLDLVELGGALLVTTPSEMSRRVVARSARMLRESGVERVALLTNMAEHVCEACGHATPLFPGDGGDALARDAGLETWARVPFDPRLAATTDGGRPWAGVAPDAASALPFAKLARRVVREWLPARVEP